MNKRIDVKHKFANQLIFTIEYIEINLNSINDHAEGPISKHLIVSNRC